MKIVFLTLVFFLQLTQNIFANHIYVPHKEGDEWIIDEFHIEKGQLQEKTNSWKYLDLSDYQKKLEEIKDIQIKNSELSPEEFAVTENITKKLWDTKGTWDLTWEKKFAEWMENEVDETFFSTYEISTDCADAMIALRWIFSRIHKLAMGTSLAGSGVLFTNESFKNAWNNLPRSEKWYEDRAFLAAIDYVMDNAYTNSLWEDTLPVAITDEHLHAGTFYLYKTKELISGHTQIVLRSERKLIIAESTVPREIRDLMVRRFYPPTPIRDYSGFRTFRWLKKNSSGKNYLLKASEHPHFSEEQYNSALVDEFGTFYNAVFSRLGLKYNFRKHLRNLKKIVKVQLKSRIEIVNEGHSLCSQADCSPGSVNYENWSTPSRDKRIKESFQGMTKVVENKGGKYFKKRFSRYLDRKKLKIADAKTMTYRKLHEVFTNDLHISDPNASIDARWNYKEE